MSGPNICHLITSKIDHFQHLQRSIQVNQTESEPRCFTSLSVSISNIFPVHDVSIHQESIHNDACWLFTDDLMGESQSLSLKINFTSISRMKALNHELEKQCCLL
jgi:hypothetical protein